MCGGDPAVSRALNTAGRAGGSPLDRDTRSILEPRFGQDLSHVRIQVDAAADRAARGIGAKAYTARGAIAFGAGRYRPESVDGLSLLAHEVAHVLQGVGSASSEPASSRLGHPGDATELAADRAAAQVVRGEAAPVASSSTAPALARSPDEAGFMETADDWWGGIKESAYDSLIGGIRSLKQRGLTELRGLARQLPPALQVVAAMVIDNVEATSDVVISLGLALIGVVVGLVSGIAHALWGLLSMLEGILEGLILLVAGLFSERYRDMFDQKANALINGLKNLPASLSLLWNNWLTRFNSASPERQSLMIGELTGEIEAILLQALAGGAAAASAGPGLEVASATSRTAALTTSVAGELAGPGAGMVFAVNVASQIDERANQARKSRSKQQAAPEPPPKTKADVDKIWKEVGKELGTDAETPKKGGVKGAVKDAKGFPRGEEPGQINSDAQFHKDASEVREAKGVTGKQYQSAHGGASSWLNKRVWRNGKPLNINYSRAAADTTLLPPDVHASFDKIWKEYAITARQSGVDRVEVGEMLRVMRQAVEGSSLGSAQQGSLMTMIDREFRALGFKATDVIELPYPNVGP